MRITSARRAPRGWGRSVRIPGIGRLTVDAITRRDYPVVQGVILFFSVALIVINLLVDLTYPLFDPRVRG